MKKKKTFEDGWQLPQVPEDERIPALLAELAGIVAEENAVEDGTYYMAYSRGRWLELKRWNGDDWDVIVPMDTRVTAQVLLDAGHAILCRRDEREERQAGVA